MGSRLRMQNLLSSQPPGKMRILLGGSTLVALVSSVQVAAQTVPTVFFGSLHSHTSLSDGSGTPAEAYAHARDVAGLDFLAITGFCHKATLQGRPGLTQGI